MAAVAWLRARPVLVVTGAVAVDLLLLLPFYLAGPTHGIVGVPAAVTSLVVVATAIVGGPRAGALTAVVAGAAYDVLIVTDRWLLAGITSATVLLVWLAAGIAAGMLGDRYRAQVRAALDQAATARRAVENVLEVTPAFHARGSLQAVAQAVCDAAVETTGCAASALVIVEDDSLRLAGRSPKGPQRDVAVLPLDVVPDLRRSLLYELEPSFVADLDAHAGPLIFRDLAETDGVASALRVPAVLNGRPVAVLALGWGEVRRCPDAAWLATMQRFADHAAVAVEQAQRVEARREATRLYRRFEASLLPQIGERLGDVRVAVSYRPGERRMRLGGDFVDAILRSDGRVRAIIGDVTGHGPDAAALGAYLRSAWRALARQDLGAPAVIRTLNGLVLEEAAATEAAGETGMLATVCAVEITADRAHASILSAGHPPAVVFSRDGTETAPLGGLPLGVRDDDWAVDTVVLPEAWTVLLYTDGLAEARLADPDAGLLGTDGLISLVADRPGPRSLDHADLDGLVTRVQDLHGGPLPDDATLLALSFGWGHDPSARVR